jgi:hypothetical protein
VPAALGGHLVLQVQAGGSWTQVRAMLKAPPKPVSASTSSGSAQAPQMRRTSSHTSFKEVMPRSGSPKEAFATPAPDR